MITYILLILFASVSLAAVSQPRETSDAQLASFSAGSSVPLIRSSTFSQPLSRKLYGRRQRSYTDLYLKEISFLAEIEIDNQQLYGRIETTSSDTWFVKPDFRCRGSAGDNTDPSECQFARAFDPNGTAFRAIPGQVFNNSYVLTYEAVGTLGTVPLKFAGLNIENQEIGLIESVAWEGDGISSGVIGLAYPYLTSAFRTNNQRDVVPCYGNQNPTNSKCNQVRYSSLIDTIFNVENLTDPVFALALSRDESQKKNGGILSFGGVPDPKDPRINVKNLQQHGVVGIRIPPGAADYSVYAVAVDGVVFPGSDQVAAKSPNGQRPGAATYLIESTLPINYYPKSVATAINAAFQPPAWFDKGAGLYFVSCNTTAAGIPSVGITINGTTFYINSKDMIHPYVDGRCASTVQQLEGEGNPNSHWVLGGAFLNNVLGVFDVGRSEIHFWSRMEYQS